MAGASIRNHHCQPIFIVQFISGGKYRAPDFGCNSATIASDDLQEGTLCLNPAVDGCERRATGFRARYYRARYYNSLTGRFLSRDPAAGKPVDPKTLHRYLYAGGDPVNRIDPRGRDAIIDYALELGESEETIAELRVTGMIVREALLNACIDLELGIFEAGGLPTPVAYDLAKALCIAILD